VEFISTFDGKISWKKAQLKNRERNSWTKISFIVVKVDDIGSGACPMMCFGRLLAALDLRRRLPER
jgi:hypothetical protein